MTQPGKVFLVHGHDNLKHGIARSLHAMTGDQPVILDEQASGSRTVIEKFEDHAGSVAFAVVLLTPDDRGGTTDGELRPRARQNVIFELGYFFAQLGRMNVAVLDAGVEHPSDMSGLVYLDVLEGGWELKLGREMRTAGFTINLNNL